MLFKLKSLPVSILKMLYNAIVAPFLDYAILSWGGAANVHIDKIFRIQKRAIRIVFHSQYLAHTSPIFKSLKILNIYNLFQYKLAIFMYLCYNNLLPPSLVQYFSLNSTVHSYNTRNADKFHMSKIRTLISYKSIFHQGPLIWNDIPKVIRNCKSLNTFKRKYKLFLMNQS